MSEKNMTLTFHGCLGIMKTQVKVGWLSWKVIIM